MYVCNFVFVCVYRCLHIYIYLYIYTYTYIDLSLYLYTHIEIFLSLSLYIYIHIYIYIYEPFLIRQRLYGQSEFARIVERFAHALVYSIYYCYTNS